MRLDWNHVTWYSKLLAVIVFVGTFTLAFYLGALWQRVEIERALSAMPAPASENTGGEEGAHCGGFIRNAPTCAAGFHCVLNISSPDTGGTCMANDSTATSTPAWANGMQIVTGQDSGNTVHLAKNERFAMQLGSSQNWTLAFDPSGVITRVANSVTTDGFQGVYEGARSGTATMTATGRPACAAGEACPQYVIEVKVIFIVGN